MCSVLTLRGRCAKDLINQMVAVSRWMRPGRGGLQSDHIPCSSSPNSSFCGRPPPAFVWSAGNSCKSRHWKRMDVPRLETAPAIGTNTNYPHNLPKSMEEGVGNLSLPSSLASGTEATRAFVVRLLGLLSRLKYSTRFCLTDWRLQVEMLIERGIIGCQSFILIVVAGSLIGSVLCFVEGFVIVVKAFIDYFRTLSQNAAQSGIIQLLIEATDMFLVGSALLTLGMGLYVMFTSSDEIKQGKDRPAVGGGGSNIKNVPMSIAEAKSKLGHVVVMILQAGILDKFKNAPLSSGLDLACFAGAVFISSASVFLLSRLAMPKVRSHAES